MAKNHHQTGTVRLRYGSSWYGYFDRKVRDPETGEEHWKKQCRLLGKKSEMGKRDAEDALEQIILREIGAAGTIAQNDSKKTFGWFVRTRWYPLKDADWNEETGKDKKCIIQHDLIDPFEHKPLEEFELFELQVHVNNLAKSRSKDRVLQICAYLRNIFAHAVQQKFLQADPAALLRTPSNLLQTDTTFLTWDQLRAVLANVELRDRCTLELDMTEALRPSELFGLKWKDFGYHQCTLQLQRRVYRGKESTRGKTKASLNRTLHLPRELTEDLWLWWHETKHSGPDDYIFPNRSGRKMDRATYLKWKMKPLAEELGLPKLTFQVIRRSIATLAQKLGTVKDVQAVLRHTRTATTTDVYMQPIPESVAQTIEAINGQLRKKPEVGNAG